MGTLLEDAGYDALLVKGEGGAVEAVAAYGPTSGGSPDA
jgi:hypothetical protein